MNAIDIELLLYWRERLSEEHVDLVSKLERVRALIAYIERVTKQDEPRL